MPKYGNVLVILFLAAALCILLIFANRSGWKTQSTGSNRDREYEQDNFANQ